MKDRRRKEGGKEKGTGKGMKVYVAIHYCDIDLCLLWANAVARAAIPATCAPRWSSSVSIVLPTLSSPPWHSIT